MIFKALTKEIGLGDRLMSLDLESTQNLESYDLVNLTRPSTQGYFDSSGVFQQAVNNSTPADYDYNPSTGLWEKKGWEIYEGSVNLFTHAENLSDASWTKNNSIIDGDILKDDSGGGNGAVFIEKNVTVDTSTEYTISIEAKPDQLEWLHIALINFTSPTNGGVYYDLTNGVVGAESTGMVGSIKQITSDLYRCSLTFMSDSSDTSGSVRFYSADGDGDVVVSRDGTSSIYLQHPQIEKGSFPTPYIPTNGSQGTRADTVADITDLSGKYGSENTTFAKINIRGGDDKYIFDLNDGTANNRIYSFRNSSNEIRLVVVNGGSTVADINGGTLADDTDGIIGYRLQDDNVAICLNGGVVQKDTDVTLPSFDRLMIAQNYNNTNQLDGALDYLKNYQKAFSDSQLQSLSS